MIRISGETLPDNKRIDIALRHIYGIGSHNSVTILKQSNVDSSKKVKDLTTDDTNKIQAIIDASYKVEGDLRQEIANNIKRLKVINAFRGLRHTKNLPSRGQRTRSNARTRRGKRVTIGALRKEVRAKLTTGETPKEDTAKK